MKIAVVRYVLFVTTIFALSSVTCQQANAQIKCPPSGDVWARGYCSLARGRHGQWVRGKAELKPDGTLLVGLGLETDSAFFGIAGWTEVYLKDKDNKEIARYKMDKCAIPGKVRKARIRDFSGTFKVPPDIARRVTHLDTNPHIADDNAPQPLGHGDWKVSVTVAKF